jgi:hypothetical protein
MIGAAALASIWHVLTLHGGARSNVTLKRRLCALDAGVAVDEPYRVAPATARATFAELGGAGTGPDKPKDEHRIRTI